MVDPQTALVQTTDFFPPIVDDPFLYGQIAAANALSDVYAMGGEPKLALNILCLPEKMDASTVQELLRGGYEKVYEAGAIIAGGHTIHGAEPIYGLAVTGFVHPDKVLTNSGAQPGDALLLTKPLGIGVLTTAAQGGSGPGGGSKPDLSPDGRIEQSRAGHHGPLSGAQLHGCYRFRPAGPQL